LDEVKAMRFKLGATALLMAFATAAPGAAPASPGYHLAGQIHGPDGGWDLASVDPAAHRLYVAKADGVMAVDLRTGAVTPNIVRTQRGHAAFVIPGTHDVISTDGNANRATIFDGLSGKVRATFATGKKPDAVAFDPATRTLWVMAPDDGAINVVDPRTARVIATVAVGGSLELGAADGKGRMFVNVEDRNDVAVIDTRARKLVTRFPLKGCDGPTGIIYAPAARELVSACANGVAIVSRPDGAFVASLPIGPHPDGAVYDPRRGLALIPSGGDGTLSVIALAPTPHVVQRIATAKSARTIALDPVTGRVYLPAADFPPQVGAGRPKMLPGTFRVLVVDPGK
jgi:DNA-binding beta-propeller fold protein YncE